MGVLVLGGACAIIVRLGMLHFSAKIPDIGSPDRHEYVRRGYIKDSTGSILAMSIDARSLYANPKELEKPEEAAAKLATSAAWAATAPSKPCRLGVSAT